LTFYTFSSLAKKGTLSSFTLFFIVTIASSVNTVMCHRELQERIEWTEIEISYLY